MDELSSWIKDQPFQGLEYFVGIVELSPHDAGHKWLLVHHGYVNKVEMNQYVIRSSQGSKAYLVICLLGVGIK